MATAARDSFVLVRSIDIIAPSVSLRTTGEIVVAGNGLNLAAIAAFMVDCKRTAGTLALAASRPDLPDDQQRRSNPAADQARSKPVPSPRQPALDRTHRPAQGLSGLIVCQAFKITEHQHRR